MMHDYSWINSELFASILSNYTDGKAIQIKQFKIQPALNDGENYGSYMLKAAVEYTNETANHTNYFVFKVNIGKTLNRTRNVFEKEICMYQDICPKLELVLEHAKIPYKLAPKFYGGDIQQFYLVMEDLLMANYKMASRLNGLNYDQMKICLKLLATWHASSVKVFQKERYDLFLKPHVHLAGSPHYRTLFEHGISGCCDAFDQVAELSDICHKLNQLKLTAFERCCAAVKRNENTCNVLNHGDLWSNNIMFFVSNAEVKPIFFDFQMSYYGSPILDVSYFLFSSSNECICSTEFELLFDYYCDQLITTMAKLDLASNLIPSKQQLYDEFNMRGCYGALFSLFSVPLRVCSTLKRDAVQRFLGNNETDHEFRQQLYSNQHARKLLANLLHYFDEKSLLN